MEGMENMIDDKEDEKQTKEPENQKPEQISKANDEGTVR